MLNYMKADLYRILHKKSMYIFYGIILIAFVGISIIVTISNGKPAVPHGGTQFFTFAPIFFGTFLFAMIYTDDLSAHSLPSAIGFGISRIKILCGKFILMIGLAAVNLLLMFAVYFITFSALGANFTSHDVFDLMMQLLPLYMLILAFTAIASSLAYGTQKSGVGLTVYLLLATNMIRGIIFLLNSASFIRDNFGDISKYWIDEIVNSLYNGIRKFEGLSMVDGEFVQTVAKINAGDVVGYCIYLFGFLILSAVVFRKKELEF